MRHTGELLLAARAAGMPVLWLNQSLPPDDSLFDMRKVHCLAGSWAPKLSTSFQWKKAISSSPSGATADSSKPRSISPCVSGGINTVVVTGVVTNICVRSTVHDAFFLRYKVLVPEDLVMATSPKAQK